MTNGSGRGRLSARIAALALAAALMLVMALADAEAKPPKSILEILEDIKAKTDTLPDDPASQSAIEAEMLTRVDIFSLNSVSEDRDKLVCTSDRALLAHVSLHVLPEGGVLRVRIDFADDGSQTNNLTITETVGLTFGVGPEDSLSLSLIAEPPDFVFALVTVQSAEGAFTECGLE